MVGYEKKQDKIEEYFLIIMVIQQKQQQQNNQSLIFIGRKFKIQIHNEN